MKKWKIEIPCQEDAPALLVYLKQLVGETQFLRFSPEDIKLSVKEEEEFIKSRNSCENSRLIIIKDGNAIISTASIDGNTLKKFKHNGEFGIAVLQKYWNQGIARLMMEDLFTWAKKHPLLKKVNLSVNEENPIAIKLYEKLGFKHEGRIIKHYFYDGRYVDSLQMGMEV